MRLVVTGTRRLSRKFHALDDAVKGKAMLGALKAGALPIMNEAKQKAPYRTGNLRRSLHVGGYASETAPELSQSTGGDIGGAEAGRTKARVQVGTDVEYAKHLEFGTSRQNAQPYLRPAFDETKDDVVDEVARALNTILKGVR